MWTSDRFFVILSIYLTTVQLDTKYVCSIDTQRQGHLQTITSIEDYERQQSNAEREVASSTNANNNNELKKRRIRSRSKGLSRLFRPNPPLCRLNTANYYPCNNGWGVLMRNGTQNDPACVERCVYIPWRQPLDFQCGSCYYRPTRAPTTGAPVTPAPTNGPTFPQPTRTPTYPKPTSAPVVQHKFSILLDLPGMETSDQAIFYNAANRWSDIIKDDLPDAPKKANWPNPFTGCSYPSVVDDVYICGIFTSIDGAGTIIGSAAPTLTRTTGSKLPVLGRMRFDTADLPSMRSSGNLVSVILHEMGHVLGIGILWKSFGITSNTSDCPYQGVNANQQYKTLSGCARVPTELDGNPGTPCVHFDETCLQTELMTSAISSTNQLSKITIASLQDLGYTSLNYSKADVYTTAHINKNCLCNRRLLENTTTTEIDTVQRDRNKQKDVYLLQKLTGDNPKSENEVATLHGDRGRTHRRLSLAGRLKAIAYGKAQLRQAKLEYEKSRLVNGNDEDDDGPSYTYVGGDVISVLIEENGYIFGVIVYSNTTI